MAFKNSSRITHVQNLSLTKGVYSSLSETAAPPDSLRDAINIIVGPDGIYRPKPDAVNRSDHSVLPFLSSYFYKTPLGRQLLLATNGPDYSFIQSLPALDGVLQPPIAALTKDLVPSFIKAPNNRVYIGNGSEVIQVLEDGVTVRGWGLPQPTVPPGISLGTGTLTVLNGRQVAYAWGCTETGHTSVCIFGTEISGIGTNLKLIYSLPTTGAPAGVTTVRIYESLDGVGVFYLSGEVPYGTATYESELTDDELVASTEEAPFEMQFPPPPGSIVIRHANRMVVAGIPDELAYFYISAGPGEVWGVPEESFTKYQDITGSLRFSVPRTGEAITGLASYAGTLWIFTEDSVYFMYGDSESTFGFITDAYTNHGTIAKKSITVTPFGLVWFTPDKIILANPTSVSSLVPDPQHGVQEISLPIRKHLMNCKADKVIGQFYSYGTKDWLVFACEQNDGSFLNLIYDVTCGAWQIQNDTKPLDLSVWEDTDGVRTLLSCDQDGFVKEITSPEDDGASHPLAWFKTPFVSPRGLGVVGIYRYLDFYTTNSLLPVRVRINADYVEDMNGGTECAIERIRDTQFRVWIPPECTYAGALQFRFDFPASTQLGGLFALKLAFTQEYFD